MLGASEMSDRQMSSGKRWLIYLLVGFVVVLGLFWLMFGNKVMGGFVAYKTLGRVDALLNPKNEEIPAGRGTLVLDFKQGDSAYHIEIGFAFKKPNCYRLDVMGDLGDHVIVAGEKKMYAYEKKRNILFIGDPSLPMWRIKIPVKVGADGKTEQSKLDQEPRIVLAGVAFGEPSEKPGSDILQELSRADLSKLIDLKYEGTQEGPGGPAKLFVLTARETAGKTFKGAKVKIWIQDYMPRLLEVSVPNEKLELKAEIKDFDVKKPLDESVFTFTAPKGAKTKVVPRKQMEKILENLPSILWDISQ